MEKQQRNSAEETNRGTTRREFLQRAAGTGLVAVAGVTLLSPADTVLAQGSQTQAGVVPTVTGPAVNDLSNLHGSMQTAINSANAGQLQMAYLIPTTTPVTHTPLVDNGHLYFADWGGNAYAADAQTGKLLWQVHLQDPNLAWPWYGFSGPGAFGNGTLFEASVEGNAFALDPNTGAMKWQSHFATNGDSGSISQLLYNDGLVYIGLSSVEEALSSQPGFQPSFQGSVVALDATTGKMVWQRSLVDPPGNGVSVWSSFALDPAMNALFFATGNNYEGDPTSMSDAVVAVNAKTGAILWAKQVLNNDLWVPGHPLGPDWDFAGGPQLFTGTVNGQTRQLVGAGAKSGIYWAFDRQTGDIVWATAISNGGVLGGIHGEASVGNNMILAWGNDSFGVNQTAGMASPADHPLTIKALDPGTGKPMWVIPGAQPAALRSPGFISNDVYLLGSMDGKFRAYRTTDGQQLFTSLLHGSITSGLAVVGNGVFFGTGAPKIFGGNGQPLGVVGYAASAASGGTTPAPAAGGTPAPPAGGTTPAPTGGGTTPAPTGGGTTPAPTGGGY